MSIELTSRTEATIHQKVTSGRYATADEAVHEALHRLDLRDQRAQRLRDSGAEGLAAIRRGEGVELTPELFDELVREGDQDERQGRPLRSDVHP